MSDLLKRQLLINQIAIMEALCMEFHYGKHIEQLKEALRLSKFFFERPEGLNDDQ